MKLDKHYENLYFWALGTKPKGRQKIYWALGKKCQIWSCSIPRISSISPPQSHLVKTEVGTVYGFGGVVFIRIDSLCYEGGFGIKTQSFAG